jgi:hypothetical protein
MCVGRDLHDLIAVLMVLVLFGWMWWVLFNSDRTEEG